MLLSRSLIIRARHRVARLNTIVIMNGILRRGLCFALVVAGASVRTLVFGARTAATTLRARAGTSAGALFIDPFERGAGENRSSPRIKLLVEYYESQFAILPARKNVSVTAAENTYMDWREAKRACEYFQKLLNKGIRFNG